ncbi:MAG: efflux RND transporter periplasmic adaptor subunit [Myxococcota bacterium]
MLVFGLGAVVGGLGAGGEGVGARFDMSPVGVAQADEGTPTDATLGADAPVTVRVASAVQAQRPAQVVMHGTLVARDRSTLSFVVGGRLLRRDVDVGDRVTKGQVLARIDPQAYRNAELAAAADLARVDAQSQQLARDERRATELEAEGFAPTSQREQVQTAQSTLAAQRRAALAQLQETRRQHTETVLRAPFDGVVRAVFGQAGEVLGPGAPVLAVADDDGLEAQVDAPERALRWLTVGGRAHVEVPGLGARRGGTVDAVARAAGPSGLYRLRIALDPASTPAAEKLAPGLGVLARVEGPAQDEVRVPLAAVVDPSGDDAAVWIVRDDMAQPRPVTVLGLRGQGDDATLAIAPRGEASAISPGTTVVVAGHARLLPGDAVRTENAGAPPPPPGRVAP